MNEKPSFRPPTLQDLIEIWKRQRWWVLVTAALLASTTCLVVGMLPSSYTSDALILIDPPAVSQDYIKPLNGVDDERQISELVQQALSRTLLQRLPLLKGGQNLSEDDFEDLLSHVNMEVLRENTDPRRPAGKPYGLKVSFTSRIPKQAEEGANELAALVVQEADQKTLQHAKDTANVLRAQLAVAVDKVRKADQALAEFKQRYSGQLPIEEQLTVQTLARLQAQMDVNGQAIERAHQTLTDLNKPASEPNGQVVDKDTSRQDPTLARLETDLQSLKDKLADLESRYQPNHPDVVKTRDEIERMEGLVKEQAAKTSAPKAVKISPTLPSSTSARIEENRAELEVRLKQQAQLEQQATQYQANLKAIPLRTQQYSDLERDYESAKKDFETLRDDVAAADQTSDVYEEHKGIRYRIQDYASLPDTPSKPVRWKINLGGLGAAVFLGLLVGGARELKDTSFKSERDVEFYTGWKLLASLPLIDSTSRPNRALRTKYLLILASIVFAAALAGLNVYIYFMRL